MTILGYTLPEIQKALIALAALVIAGVALFVGLDPGFQAGVETLIIALVGVVAVFALPNPSVDQLNKALAALVTASVSVIQFYHTVPSSVTTKVIALCYALAVAVVVYWKGNAAARR